MLAVIGAQGFLGRHLAAHWRRTGQPVLTVSHLPGSDIRLDYRERDAVSAFHLPSEVSHAVICSAVTSLDQCFLDRSRARNANVHFAIALLQKLFSLGITPIYCSTDLVFKGTTGSYRENDPREPTTQYGRQKKAVEDFLFAQRLPSLILRMSKMVSLEAGDPSPVGEIWRKLQKRETVLCAHDQRISPMSVQDVAKVLHWAIQTGRTGCYHISGMRSYSRYELGLLIGNALGSAGLIRRCSITDLPFAEQRPKDVTLNTEKLRAEYPCSFLTLEELVPQLRVIDRTDHVKSHMRHQAMAPSPNI